MMRGGSHEGAMEIELRGNLPLEELAHWSDAMIERLAAHGGFVDLDRSLKLGQPELRVIPDREKAAALGIDGRTLAQAVQIMIGGLDVGVFKEAGRRYDIRMRLEPRRSPRPGGDRAALRARERRRRRRAAQRGAHRARRRAVRDHAPRPPAQRDALREPRGHAHGGGVARGARDRRRGPAAERADRARRATPSRCRRASSSPASRSGSACS